MRINSPLFYFIYMSKSSRKRKAQRRLDSKMGNYDKFGGKSPYSGHKLNKPGSKQIK